MEKEEEEEEKSNGTGKDEGGGRRRCKMQLGRGGRTDTQRWTMLHFQGGLPMSPLPPPYPATERLNPAASGR